MIKTKPHFEKKKIASIRFSKAIAQKSHAENIKHEKEVTTYYTQYVLLHFVAKL